MRDILWLVQNTLRVTFKQKKNLIMYLCMPLIGIFIALLAHGGGETATLRVGVVNHDENMITTNTIKFLEGLENVKITPVKDSEVQDELTSGSLDSVITFENGFSKSVLGGSPDNIQLTSIKGTEITGFIKAYLYQYIDNIATISQAANGDQQTFQTMYKNYQESGFKLTATSMADTSKNKAMTYQTIGFLIMIMLMSAGNMSEIILSEKENRTYFRLLSTPINAKKYILSNVIVNMIVMTMQILITLTIMTRVFGIDINIPFWTAAAVLFLFALIAVGISLIITAFSNSRSAAGALQNVIILPTVMISGCFWPVEVMPDSIQKIAEFLPQRWTLDTLTKLQEGSTLGNLQLNIMILLAFAAVFYLIAIYKFSRNNDARNFI